jgi:hypothetical protein
VTAGDTGNIVFAYKSDAFGGLCIVTDDIAETDDTIHRLRRHIRECRGERFEIGVYIGNERKSHEFARGFPGCG